MRLISKFIQHFGSRPSDWWAYFRTKPKFYEEFPRTHASELSSTSISASFAISNTGIPFLKWAHYFPIYDSLISGIRLESNHSIQNPVRFLEIGVDRGGSLNMWRALLGSHAKIVGIDINPECSKITGVEADIKIGSQDDVEFLHRVVKEMGGLDVVLDDGSHASRHVIKSFQTLFPLMEDQGIYIIEDVHASYWPFWRLGGGLRRKKTTIEYFKNKVDQMHQEYFRANAGLRKFKEEPITGISSIEFYDSIIVIRKAELTQAPFLVESGISQFNRHASIQSVQK